MKRRLGCAIRYSKSLSLSGPLITLGHGHYHLRQHGAPLELKLLQGTFSEIVSVQGGGQVLRAEQTNTNRDIEALAD